MKNKIKNSVVVLSLLATIAVFGVIVGYAVWDTQQGIDDFSPAEIRKLSSPKESKSDLIKVSFPQENEKVGGIINVTGIARGGWYFEGEFPVSLEDLKGNELASGIAMARGEWMIEDFVPFSASLTYRVDSSLPAKIILKRNNPSDLREQDAQIEIPVIIEPDTTSAEIFLTSQYINKAESICKQVFPVSRAFGETMALPRQALESLFEGSTESEKLLGYDSVIPLGVRINQFDINSGKANVDLSAEILDLEVDVPCRRIMIQEQITQTLKSSSDVEVVNITVKGKPFPGEFLNEGPSSE